MAGGESVEVQRGQNALLINVPYFKVVGVWAVSRFHLLFIHLYSDGPRLADLKSINY